MAAIATLYAMEAVHGARPPATVASLAGLTDADGRRVEAGNLDRRYKLVFFGFTQCAAVCPMTLVKVRAILTDVGAGAAGLAPLFISVDPEHDRLPSTTLRGCISWVPIIAC